MTPSPSSQAKKRIQKLLTQYVRLRDGGCVLKKFGACSGYTAADHIFSRASNATYADPLNLICLCQRHHIYWKPQHPMEYADFVESRLGKNYKKLKWKSQTILHMTEYDWLLTEKWLKKEIEKLENERK